MDRSDGCWRRWASAAATLLSLNAVAGLSSCKRAPLATPTGTATPAADPAKELTAFAFRTAHNPTLPADVNATILGTDIAATVPFGTNVSALVATFTTTGASVVVGATTQASDQTANDFSGPLVYRVVAADGTTQDYTVTVTVGVVVTPSTAKDLTAFAFRSAYNPTLAADVFAAIDGTLVAVTVPFGTDVVALVATFTTNGAQVLVGATAQVSDQTANDFTGPLIYRVVAADETFRDYTVTVTVAVDTAKELTAFAFLAANNPTLPSDVNATFNGSYIDATVPFGVDVSALVATFTTTGVLVVVGVALQVSDQTTNDFTLPLIYRVTAADGSVWDYTVTVTVAANPNQLTSFALLSANNPTLPADIAATFAGTDVTATVPFGTNVRNLVATFAATGDVAVGSTLQTSDQTPNDFSGPLVYRVSGIGGFSADYTVTVVIGCGGNGSTPAAPTSEPFVPGKVLAKIAAGISPAEEQRLLEVCGLTFESEIVPIGIKTFAVPVGTEQQVVASLSTDLRVKFAQVNTLLSPAFIPDDPQWADQWHLTKINAPAAWDAVVAGNHISSIPGMPTAWTPASAAPVGQLASVAFGNGVFVAVGSGGVATSSDGVTWTPRTSVDWIVPTAMVPWGTMGVRVGPDFDPTIDLPFTLPRFTALYLGLGPFPGAASGPLYYYPFVPESQSSANSAFVHFASVACSHYPDNPVYCGTLASIERDPANNRLMATTSAGYTASLNWAIGDANCGGCCSDPNCYHYLRTYPIVLQPPPETWGWKAVTYGNGQFVAVGPPGHVMTSPDGSTWTAHDAHDGNYHVGVNWQAVTYGNGLYVAVGNNDEVMTSPNGITWTRRATIGNGYLWRSVAYGNGVFVAVAGAAPAQPGRCAGTCVMTSPDGVTWTGQTSAGDNSWQSVAYGNDTFVAVGTIAGTPVMTSADGATWAAQTAPGANWIHVTYGGSHFVAVGKSVSGAGAMASADGLSWVLGSTPAPGVYYEWESVAHGGNRFVAVAKNVNSPSTTGPVMLAVPETKLGNTGIITAIVDTGVNCAHPDFLDEDLVTSCVSGWNVISSNANTSDLQGHGTAVAGTAAAVTNNGEGLASVSLRSRIMPIRVATSGTSDIATVAAGLTWAAGAARVANVSFAGITASPAIATAAQHFQSLGGVVVAASGNTDQVFEGVDGPHLLVVSATKQDDVIADFSTVGDAIDVCAPGVDIPVLTSGGGYAVQQGTSLAAPIVAGLAALVLAVNPALTGAQVQAVIKSSADNLGPSGWDFEYGWGRVNAGWDPLESTCRHASLSIL